MALCEICSKYIRRRTRVTLLKEFEEQDVLCDDHYIEFLEFTISRSKTEVTSGSYERYKILLEPTSKPTKQNTSRPKM